MYRAELAPFSFLVWMCFLFISSISSANTDNKNVELDISKSLAWGPGLNPKIVLPVRYFFIQLKDSNGNNFTRPLEENLQVSISQSNGNGVRVWAQVIQAKNGFLIVRFRPHNSVKDIKVSVMYKGRHILDSPFYLKGHIYSEKCYCPVNSLSKWFTLMECPTTYSQVEDDLRPFTSVDLENVAKEAVSRFNRAGMHSLCHYKIIDNKIYRKTHGQHVGFKMFSDAILLSLTRKVRLPDVEFFVNLGDWPLEKRKPSENPIPIFSWCGSDDTLDIVMPTYDITEATLEMMGRVTLDIISTQGNTGPVWEDKISQGFWRGRDSRQERLDLVMMSRKKPELIDAALTNMFFFPKDPEKYGDIVKHVSFFDFFKYKYQINLDGTVAAYRMPYLLAGDSVVLKQDSSYYEHFYRDLLPNVHYIPFRRDLSNLEGRLKWAMKNDKKCKEISQNSQQFVRDHLMPKDIFCYHVKVFHEFSKRQKSKPLPPGDEFELVEQPSDNDAQCTCTRLAKEKKKTEKLKKDEL